MGNIVFLAVFISIVFSGKMHILLGDVDTGYHIRAGEIILETLSVPKYDLFSFHSPSLPWTAHEWLSEVIMALIHQVYGLTGIVVFFALLISATYWMLFKILRRDNRNILVGAFLVFLVVASSTLHWLARPHIFSLLLILAYHYVLDRYEYQKKNYLYLLPLMMIVWVNLHGGGSIVGLILVGIYFGGNLARYLFAKAERTAAANKTPAFGLVLLGCLLASLINPQGIHILTFPLNLVSDTFLMNNVAEFQSPNFHGTMPFRYLLFLTIAIFAVSTAKADLIEAALLILFLHMALYSARYITLFAIVAAPILARHADLLLKQTKAAVVDHFRRRSANMALVDSSLPGYFWPAVAAVAVFIALYTGRIHFHFDEKANPVAAVEFLKKEGLPGNMFNDDSFGDYVIYAAWPQYKVFIDGRTDMYGASLVREYVKVVGLDPDWERLLDKCDINWVFHPTDSPLSILLLERSDWRLIYADNVASIFMRNTPANGSAIEKFKHVRPLPPDMLLKTSEQRS
jgi:hypothetical protein